jgi:hypothetical protein
MLVDLWLTALKADIGIAIVTDNRGVLRQHLYKARIEANNPDLDSLTMLMPEQDDEIWLVHKDADGIGTDNKGYPKLVR